VRHASRMTNGPTVLTRSRLRLVPATSAMIGAELDGLERLAETLDATVPPDWPLEHHDVETLRFCRHALARPDAAGWWLHYVVVVDSGRRVLVGSVGYKGPPADGSQKGHVDERGTVGVRYEQGRRLVFRPLSKGSVMTAVCCPSCRLRFAPVAAAYLVRCPECGEPPQRIASFERVVGFRLVGPQDVPHSVPQAAAVSVAVPEPGGPRS
jgi:hypothetical protein